MSLSYIVADEILNMTLRESTQPHLLLHIGDPGPLGENNVAQNNSSNIDRKPITFSEPGNHSYNEERYCFSNSANSWVEGEIDPGQTITHFSVWDGETGTAIKYINSLPNPRIVGSDGIVLNAEGLEIGVTVFSKPS